MSEAGLFEQLLHEIRELNRNLQRLDLGRPAASLGAPTQGGPILDSPWMTVADVVDRASSGRTEVMGALADGSLTGHQLRPGGRWRIHRDAVDAWIRGEPYEPGRPTFTRSWTQSAQL